MHLNQLWEKLEKNKQTNNPKTSEFFISYFVHSGMLHIKLSAGFYSQDSVNGTWICFYMHNMDAPFLIFSSYDIFTMQ